MQVDTYDRATARLARTLPLIVADRRLRWREDRPFWGRSSYEFVSVRLPADATEAQWVAAVNAATRHSPDVRSTSSRIPVTRGRITIAWRLTGTATPKRAWGPANRDVQRLIAHNG